MAAGVPAWLVAEALAATPWLAFVAGGAVYGLAYLALCYAPGIAEPAAIRLPIAEKLKSTPIVGHTLRVCRASLKGLPHDSRAQV
jgi:hypothetical protein